MTRAVGLALVQFVWQGAAIGAACALVLAALKHSTAHARYIVGVLGLAMMAAVPTAAVVGNWHDGVDTEFSSAGTWRSASGTGAQDSFTAAPNDARDISVRTAPSTLSFGERARAWVEPRLPLIVTLWTAGVLLFAGHLAGGWLRIARLRHRSTPLSLDRWTTTLAALADRLGVRGRIRLLESALVDVPAVIGVLRPAIVVPVSALAGLSPAHVEAILAHELAHIQRGDFLVNIAQCVIETLLFYHPAVWWVSRQIRIEREHCCDDLAAATCGDPVWYAHALASLEELRAESSRLALAATGGDLLRRVRRLVTPAPNSIPAFSGGFVMTTALAVLLLTVCGATQGITLPVPAAAPIVRISAKVPPAPAPLPAPAPVKARVSPKVTPVLPAAPLPAVQPITSAAARQSQTPATRVEGTVVDSSGGSIPGARIALTAAGGAVWTATSNGAGRFTYPGVVPPGRYQVAASMTGFEPAMISIDVADNQPVSLRFRMQIGRLEQMVFVKASGPSGTPGVTAIDKERLLGLIDQLRQAVMEDRRIEAESLMSQAQARLRDARLADANIRILGPKSELTSSLKSTASLEPSNAIVAPPSQNVPIRVGGDIRSARPLSMPAPVYPKFAEAAQVFGIVTVEAVIEKDGRIRDAKATSGPALLNQAALSAVGQWQFAPTLLGGVPVETPLVVTVQFVK